MTDFSDLKTQIAEWTNRQDRPDAVVTSWIRMAEQKFNAELKVDRMLKTAVNTVDHSCAPLPDDWIESDFMLVQNTSAPQGWIPIQYMPRDQFFRTPSTSYSSYRPDDNSSTFGRYTIRGRTIFFGGPQDATNGVAFEMDYFAEVPVFSDTVDSWIYTKYPSLYLHASLAFSDMYAQGEEDKAGGLLTLVEAEIQKLNAIYYKSKASGSIVSKGRKLSFG